MSITGKIRTPKGKWITPGQYIGLALRNEQVCEHGHLGCAAWNDGPCSDELSSAMESGEQHFIANERG